MRDEAITHGTHTPPHVELSSVSVELCCVAALRLNVPISVQRWAIVFPARHKDSARELCNTLQRVGPPMGMQFANPQM